METNIIGAAAVAIAGVLLLAAFAAILWRLKSNMSARNKPLEIEKINSRPIAAESKKGRKNPRKRGALTIAGETFEFEYDEADEAEARKLLELIKHSLSLLKETKYPDIVLSRARECENLIKKLKSCTDMGDLEVGEIAARFKEYAANLASSLRVL